MLRLYKEEKDYLMQPLTMGTSMRISREILKITPENISQEEFMTVCYHAFDQYAPLVATVVALAITNTKKPPSQSLVELLLENLTPHELLQVMQVVVKQMDIQNFMTSIVSARGINILKVPETSPMDQRGQIASGEQWEAL